MFTSPCSRWLCLVPCISLASGGARAHTDHGRHPQHATGTTLVTFAQAVSLGAQKGPDSNKAKAALAATSDLQDAAPSVAQLPFVQTQVGPRLSASNVAPEVILSVAQPFAWSDAAGVQKRVAHATQRLAATATRGAELSDAERAAHAWLDLALADEVLERRRESATSAASLLAIAQARVATGEAQPIELALAKSELADALASVMSAEGLHATAELDLAYALGLPPSTHVDVDERLSPMPAFTSNVTAGVHPAVLAAEDRWQLTQEQIGYAKVQQAPIVTLGVQYQREGTGDQILTAVATIPIPVARPWAFQEAQQRLSAEVARAEVNYVRTLNALETSRAEHEQAHTRSQYDHLQQAALPPLREAHRLALARFTSGATDFSELSLIRQRLLRAEEQLAQALANVHHARVRTLAAHGKLTASDLQ